MIKLNKETLRDKIYACWIGKNIGGTMGTPYEGTRELLDIQGFSTPEGVVLPNDDLDLQLAWLLAMEEHGPYQLNAQILGEYWLAYVVPHWNEYGIGKGNMKAGLLPPLAGIIAICGRIPTALGSVLRCGPVWLPAVPTRLFATLWRTPASIMAWAREPMPNSLQPLWKAPLLWFRISGSSLRSGLSKIRRIAGSPAASGWQWIPMIRASIGKRPVSSSWRTAQIWGGSRPRPMWPM